jgi:hypothetical protein
MAVPEASPPSAKESSMNQPRTHAHLALTSLVTAILLAGCGGGDEPLASTQAIDPQAPAMGAAADAPTVAPRRRRAWR